MSLRLGQEPSCSLRYPWYHVTEAGADENLRLSRSTWHAVQVDQVGCTNTTHLRGPGAQRQAVLLLLLALRIVAIGWVVTSLINTLVTPSALKVLVIIATGIWLGSSFVRWGFMLLATEDAAPAARESLRVAVVTTFVPEAEPLEMLEETLIAIINMEYPHDTWVLDEGDDLSVKAMCSRLGVRHWTRRGRPEYQRKEGAFQRATKHGNYNAWLHEVGFEVYDIMAGIDPDQVPQLHFLTSTLGHFRDEQIGYVQSPQEYHNAETSWIARGCDEESRDFYWITQKASHRFGSPSVIGAHNIHRVKALKSVGGLAPHVADDLLLTLHYQLSGWRGAYVPQVLARGLAPVDWGTYIKQQRRWARSLLDVKLRVYPRLAANLGVWARVVGLLQGLSYLQDGVVAVCMLLALTIALLTGVPPVLVSAVGSMELLGCVAALAITGLYPHVYHPSHVPRGLYWRSACLRFAKWPFTFQALWEVISGRTYGYDLTVKTRAPSAARILFWPHLLLSGIIVCAAIAGLLGNRTNSPLVYICAAAFVLASLLLIMSNLLTAAAAFAGTSGAKDRR